MTVKNIRFADVAGLFVGVFLGIAVLMLLAGCANSPPWGSSSKVPTPQEIQAALRRPNVFIYFSNYEIYENPSRGEFVFWDGSTWVTAHEPPLEVSAELLHSSPHVELALGDHPSRHHAEVVRHHPRDWKNPDRLVVANP